MPTNLKINDKLLSEAMEVGGHETKKDTVSEALTEYVQRRKQRGVIKLFGTIDYDSSYAPKSYRKRSK
jgi:hypothetical protein